MASQVYSRSFIVSRGSADVISTPPMPAGYIWVVRDISFFNNNNSAIGIAVYVEPQAVFILNVPSLGGYESYHWTGRAVIDYPGSNITASAAPGMHVYISGYQLTLP